MLDPGGYAGAWILRLHANTPGTWPASSLRAGLHPVFPLTGDDSAEERQGEGTPPASKRARFAVFFPLRCLEKALMCLMSTASLAASPNSLGDRLYTAARSGPTPCATVRAILTVIDLIGQHRKEFRFEDRLQCDPRAPKRGRVLAQVEADFPFLPCWLHFGSGSAESRTDPRESPRPRYGGPAGRPLCRTYAPSNGEGRTRRVLGSTPPSGLEDVYGSGRSWTNLLKREAGRLRSPTP